MLHTKKYRKVLFQPDLVVHENTLTTNSSLTLSWLEVHVGFRYFHSISTNLIVIEMYKLHMCCSLIGSPHCCTQWYIAHCCNVLVLHNSLHFTTMHHPALKHTTEDYNLLSSCAHPQISSSCFTFQFCCTLLSIAPLLHDRMLQCTLLYCLCT